MTVFALFGNLIGGDRYWLVGIKNGESKSGRRRCRAAIITPGVIVAEMEMLLTYCPRTLFGCSRHDVIDEGLDVVDDLGGIEAGLPDDSVDDSGRIVAELAPFPPCIR
jgi:hypothetical protein